MLGSTILEVAIGLIFLYVTLSTVCSTIVEYIGAVLDRRAKFLRAALINLFNGRDPAAQSFLVDFYQSGLVTALAPTNPNPKELAPARAPASAARGAAPAAPPTIREITHETPT